MTVHTFVSPAAGPAERARAFGAAWRAEIGANLEGYLRLFAAVGAPADRVRPWSEAALDQTAAWAPALAEEITGIAAGAGIEPWQAAALNARTEILAAAGHRGRGECSTAVVLPAGGGAPRTTQTWDWHDALGADLVVWAVEPRPGHTVRCFTEFGVLGKIGVNSAGVGVHFNILRHTSDHAGIGVPVHVVARRILDDAASVAEAAEIARSARVSASSVITVAAAGGGRGEARCLELCPQGVAELHPDDDGVLLHTNHFLDPVLAEGQQPILDDSSTHPRLAALGDRAAALGAQDPLERAGALLDHEADGSGICCHPDPAKPFHERWQTLLTIALDLENARLAYHGGGPCTAAPDTWHTF
ncbi:C45 family autoproteolytic acyltransferase/hydrolase [Nocardiopsis sediminis]|uniref:C45 family autoproteolytic acyltransferase/hydrolase n=1 Tax=Nocardiopsis sediminis TaxID=1778267 RepID=A0ABV8FQI1_9ACTN